MTKRHINLILILIILIIWGGVGLKIFKRHDNSSNIHVRNTKMKVEFKNLKKDTFSLKILENDPFTGNRLSNVKENTLRINKPLAKRKLIKEHSNKTHTNMPIKYYGNLSVNGKNIKAILKIGDDIKRLGVGETFNDLKLLKITKDSVIYRSNNNLGVAKR